MNPSCDPRPLMVEVAHLLYDRYLTNSAGGNLSCRVGGHIYITPRGLGSKHRWRLRENMVLIFDGDLNPAEGDPSMVSRESQLHFACYRNFSEVNGVIHAHPRYLSVFATAGKSLPPTTEYTQKFDPVEVVRSLPGGLDGDLLEVQDADQHLPVAIRDPAASLVNERAQLLASQ